MWSAAAKNYWSASSRGKMTAATVASALVLLQNERSRRRTDVEVAGVPPTPISSPHAAMSPSVVPVLSSSLSMIPLGNFHSSPICLCEGAPPQGKDSRKTRAMSLTSIQRQATIRRLDMTSTQKSLQSKYDVMWKRPLGEGSFGAVYAAFNRETHEKVALKKIPKRFTDKVSFQREMNALIHVRVNGGHPNICSLRENFDEGSHYYLILDLVTGGEMFDHLIRNGSYSEADAARLVREVASALAFLHGIGVVHGDLKPENLMLSSTNPSDAVIKIVDFGCAEVLADDFADLDEVSKPIVPKPGSKPENSSSKDSQLGGNTPAYCPPEALQRTSAPIASSADMWSLGVILYIMLTGLHPFDLSGNSTDEEIEHKIQSRQSPPLRKSPITAHLSPSAINLIEKLIAWNPKDRISAMNMLSHPWVRGKTARTNKMEGSDKKLSLFRVFKSKLEADVFKSFVGWSDDNADNIAKKTSLLERSFHSFDTQRKGYLTTKDLKCLDKDEKTSQSSSEKDPGDGTDSSSLSFSGFSDLLSENMKNRYFPTGHVVYHEGDIGNHMYFINSGTIEVTTKDGSVARRSQGDFFGEGALLHPKKIRSASIKCVTPVHAIEISRRYFEKYLKSSKSDLNLNLREKDRTRKRNRAKTILRLQKNLREFEIGKGEAIYKEGEEGEELFILEQGKANVLVEGNIVFDVKPGDICGEHALIMGRPRNTSAVCSSDRCIFHAMKARDFYEIYNSSSSMRESLRELCLRREFQKALVMKTKKSFPSVDDLREAFDAADEDKSGYLSLQEVRNLLRTLDRSLLEKEIKEVVQSLDLDDSGSVSFEAFSHIFGINEQRGSSI